MPTPPPEPVKEPESKEELEARFWAQNFVHCFLQKLHSYTYGSRSHVPGGLDCTEFFHSLDEVTKWVTARPDWTLDILTDVIERNPRQIPASMEKIVAEKDAAITHMEYKNKELKRKLDEKYEESYERRSHISDIEQLKEKLKKSEELAKTIMTAAKELERGY